MDYRIINTRPVSDFDSETQSKSRVGSIAKGILVFKYLLALLFLILILMDTSTV